MDGNSENVEVKKTDLPKGAKAKRGAGSIYLRGGTWWIRYSHNGKEHRESARTDSERKAQAFLTAKIQATGRREWVDPSKTRRLTFDDLAKAVRADYVEKRRRSTQRLEGSLKHLEAYFGLDRTADITEARVRDYKRQRCAAGAAGGTVNRELAALTHAFRCLKLTPPPIEMYEEADPRQGFLEHTDWIKLRDALPPYLRDPVTFLYLSGWRLREMTGLEWSEVRADEIELPVSKSKNKKARKLPIEGELADVMARAAAARRDDCLFVFHHAGRQIRSFRGAWAKSCKSALARKLLVHDLRRTAVRDMSRSGVPDTITMQLTGHKTRTVFDRYNISSTDDLAAALRRRDAYHGHGQPPKRNPGPKIIPIPKRAASR